jgi:hypothetical protein
MNYIQLESTHKMYNLAPENKTNLLTLQIKIKKKEEEEALNSRSRQTQIFVDGATKSF